jgi:hypothetical protein
MKNVVSDAPRGNLSKCCISRPTKGKGYKGVRMRIDSALQISLTDLNDLLIEGHSGKGQGQDRVWS